MDALLRGLELLLFFFKDLLETHCSSLPLVFTRTEKADGHDV